MSFVSNDLDSEFDRAESTGSPLYPPFSEESVLDSDDYEDQESVPPPKTRSRSKASGAGKIRVYSSPDSSAIPCRQVTNVLKEKNPNLPLDADRGEDPDSNKSGASAGQKAPRTKSLDRNYNEAACVSSFLIESWISIAW